MVGPTPRARKDDRQRMDTIVHYCGCLPCLLMGYLDVHTSIEHVTERGRRIGGDEQHQWTIGLCVWHHFGHASNHGSRQQISGMRGPSLVWGRKTFEDHFGDEVQVLVPTQNFMLAEFEMSPWQEYNVPREVARDTRLEWIRLNANAQSRSSRKSRSG
jgi:Recombination enhancement, RecA-dependent nuclease